MEDIDEIRLRLRFSKLEAKLALTEIEMSACSREIRSPLTPAHRCEEVAARRDQLLSHASLLRAELDLLRRSHPDLARH